jgi:hypothetical protein
MPASWSSLGRGRPAGHHGGHRPLLEEPLRHSGHPRLAVALINPLRTHWFAGGGPRLPDPPAALGGRHLDEQKPRCARLEGFSLHANFASLRTLGTSSSTSAATSCALPLALERLQLVHAVPVATGPSWYGWTLRALYGAGLPLRKSVPALTAWKKRSSCTAGSYACASGSVSATIARASCPLRASRLG